jgi:hypothetical protein
MLNAITYTAGASVFVGTTTTARVAVAAGTIVGARAGTIVGARAGTPVSVGSGVGLGVSVGVSVGGAVGASVGARRSVRVLTTGNVAGAAVVALSTVDAAVGALGVAAVPPPHAFNTSIAINTNQIGFIQLRRTQLKIECRRLSVGKYKRRLPSI